MRVYIAGPMRGVREFGFPAFHKAAETLKAAGHLVFNPAAHDVNNGFDPTGMTGDEDLSALGFDLRNALAADTGFICGSADAIAVLEGWQRSKGARAEVALAAALGLKAGTVNMVATWDPKDLPTAQEVIDAARNGRFAEQFFAVPVEEAAPSAADWKMLRSDQIHVIASPPYQAPWQDFTETELVAQVGHLHDRDGTCLKRRRQARCGEVDVLMPAVKQLVSEGVAPGQATHDVARAAGGRGSLESALDSAWRAQDGEVRVTNAVTGGEKGSKLQRFDLLPVEALTLVAEHYGRGALKYADNQWRKGYDWSLSYAALQRHATQFWGGEDVDAETGSPHMAAVAWHALTLLTFALEHPELDDRPSAKDAAPAELHITNTGNRPGTRVVIDGSGFLDITDRLYRKGLIPNPEKR